MPPTSRSSPVRPAPPRAAAPAEGLARDDPDAAPAPEPTDAALIAASRTDPERFAALFRRHAPAIMRYTVRRLGQDPAEDVVAETFLVAFGRRAAYDPARPDARPWLYGIATNLIRRHRRAEVRALRALARGGADPVTEPFTDAVEDRVHAGARSRALAGAIAALPAAQREVLLLVTWAELTYDEAAEALGVPPGTVRSRMNRIRRRLRDALGDAADPRREAHDG
ncbi:RNA polymerase sigma factor [Actinomadura verrucosospora]|uniref:ECF subfamily RNA polymerase sigma-24 subunit n=1 Tax=Actinomadura verrucosospora TaxID=46165 RepID=A0A7D3ZE21_ACTVE|nr:RNA polymerase sigma factor [Actinomadura verrucosospora]QKG20797.1 ECF subfamily RNA polymerase sigma-24 subunit [Actinomadura verrucosospora]